MKLSLLRDDMMMHIEIQKNQLKKNKTFRISNYNKVTGYWVDAQKDMK